MAIKKNNSKLTRLANRLSRESINHEVDAEEIIIHDAYRKTSGAIYGEARIVGRITVNGEKYEGEIIVQIPMKKEKKKA
jgi:hypothetical protein